MLLNLRMGYHFATVEALVTDEPSKNYVRVQFKQGGAPVDRRLRRVKLIATLLGRLGFQSSSEGDFLDAIVAYQDAETLLQSLAVVGRINIITKQLDMALVNDAVAEWYTQDFLRLLGLAVADADAPPRAPAAAGDGAPKAGPGTR